MAQPSHLKFFHMSQKLSDAHILDFCPRAISQTSRANHTNTNMTKYAIIKEAPPLSYTRKGNFHKFHSPAAEPIAASINTLLLDHKCLFTVSISKIIKK